MQMYRVVLANNSELDNAAENFVCVVAHREDYPKAWNDASMQYMPQYFFTPNYTFLSPDGKPLEADFMRDTMHRGVTAADIIAKLKSVSAKYPKPLDRNKWLELRKNLDDLRSKDPAEAVKLFAEKEKLFAGTNLAKEAGILKNRANAVVVCAEFRKNLDIELKNIALAEEYMKAMIEKVKFDLAKQLKAAKIENPEEFLEKKNDSLESERREVLGDAVNSVKEGDYFAAKQRISLFLGAYPENEFPGENAILLAIKPVLENAAEVGRFRVQKLSFDNGGEYFEIGVALKTHIPRFGELTIQYYALTEYNSVFAGYRSFDNVTEGRHRNAAYLPVSALGTIIDADGKPRMEGVSDVYVEIYSHGYLVASGEMNSAPAAAWWKREDFKPLEMLDSFGKNFDSGTMKPSGEPGIIYGK